MMLVAVAGFILWLVIGIAGLSSSVDHFVRASVPGEQTVQLDARKYIVYGESTGNFEPNFAIQVIDPETGTAVPIAPYFGSLTYSFGHHGWAKGTMTPPHAGSYRVITTGEGTSGASVAFGSSFAGRLVATIVGAFAFGAIAGLTGLILLIVTGVRRSRARRVMQQPPWQGAPRAQPY